MSKIFLHVQQRDHFAEEVYGTLCGLYLPEDEVPGVENLFATGSVYETIENEVYRLREQLEGRLWGIESQ